VFIRARTIDAIGLAMRKGGSDGRESLNIETFMHPPVCPRDWSCQGHDRPERLRIEIED